VTALSTVTLQEKMAKGVLTSYKKRPAEKDKSELERDRGKKRGHRLGCDLRQGEES